MPTTPRETDIQQIGVEQIALDAQVRQVPETLVEEYVERLEAEEEFPPLVVFHDDHDAKHYLADGFIRLAAHRRFGSAHVRCEVRQGGKRDAVFFAAGANRAHGHRLTNADKTAAVTVLLRDPDWVRMSDRQIAQHVGVSPTFVGNLRRAVHGGESSTKRTTADGRIMETGNIGKKASKAPAPADRTNSTWTPASTSSTSVEGYTPAKYADAARAALGGSIELDPASCEAANQNVKASRFFTQDDDGLSLPWKARTVFLNPPYGRDGQQSNAGRWSAKLIEEHEAGNMEEAVILVFARTETEWFQPLWKFPICFVDHPVSFVPADGKARGAAKTGVACVYLGPHVERFEEAFAELGHVVLPRTNPVLGPDTSRATTKSGVVTPLAWYGGKASHTAKLLPLLPPHEHFVEVLGGGAGLLTAKSPGLSKGETYNDIHDGLVSFYAVLRDPAKSRKLHELLRLTPNAREERRRCKTGWAEAEDEVERARQFFVSVRQSMNGNGGWRHFARSRVDRCGEFARIVDTLPAVAERFRSVQVEHRPFEKLIPKYDMPTTLFYLDPPYVPDTRRTPGYDHEMTDDDHRRLVNILLGIQGMAVLSGYDNDIYRPLEEAGWQRITYHKKCSAAPVERGGKREKRTEVVWLNPAAVAALASQTHAGGAQVPSSTKKFAEGSSEMPAAA